jgi:hypothetical protein
MVLRTSTRQSYATTRAFVVQELTHRKYSAFSLCLDQELWNATTSVIHVAQALAAQREVAEFVAVYPAMMPI